MATKAAAGQTGSISADTDSCTDTARAPAPAQASSGDDPGRGDNFTFFHTRLSQNHTK
jgi:hypothetical protein